MPKKSVKIFYGIAIFLTLLYLNPLSASDWNSYKASNYHNLIGTDQAVYKLQNLLKKDRIFLMVSGCHLDKEAMPAFIKMSKKYPKAIFVRINQFGETAEFMNKRFRSFGAPKIYAFGNDSLVSEMYHTFSFEGGRKFLGWEKSMEEWIDKVYPILDQMAQQKNVRGISPLSPKSIFKDRLVLFQGNIILNTYPQDVTVFLKLAKKHPEKKFVISVGNIVDYRYRSVHNSISIIENHRMYAHHRRLDGYNLNATNEWLSKNYNNTEPIFRNKKTANSISEINNAIEELESYRLAATPPQIIAQYRKTQSKPVFMQTFYVVIQATEDPDRKKESIIELLQLLYFKEAGGIQKMLPNPIVRKKIYKVILENMAENETDSKIRKELESLTEAYNK